jgi:hypothetical protein
MGNPTQATFRPRTHNPKVAGSNPAPVLLEAPANVGVSLFLRLPGTASAGINWASCAVRNASGAVRTALFTLDATAMLAPADTPACRPQQEPSSVRRECRVHTRKRHCPSRVTQESRRCRCTSTRVCACGTFKRPNRHRSGCSASPCHGGGVDACRQGHGNPCLQPSRPRHLLLKRGCASA